MSKTPVAVFHPGTQHSWQTAQALAAIDRLAWYATSIFYKPGEWPYRLERLPGPLGRALEREFGRFRHDGLDPAVVRTFGFHEWLERLAARAGFKGLAHTIDKRGNLAFGRAMEREIASDAPFHLWGYDNSSLTAFRAGKRSGRTCILDRTVGDLRAYNRDMLELQERFGDWFVTKGLQYDDELTSRAAEEHELADRILVGCPFAARTVEDCNPPEVAAKVEVLEYSYNSANFANIPAPQPVDRKAPVRFLFLGLVIPRKGIHHVLEAIAQLPPSEASLTVVGNLGIPREVFDRYRDRITYIPTVPRREVAAIMAAHDVFLFPSYFEGAGIVLYEALACGMALIQSDRAAIAVTPETGVLLDQLDTETLLAAMRTAIEDRGLLDFWRANAQGEAQAYTFERYSGRIAAFLDRLDERGIPPNPDRSTSAP